MTKLDKKVQVAIEALKEKGITIKVDIKGRIFRSKYLEITTALDESSENKDIECAAEIEKAMREALGYGTFSKSYDIRNRVMTATYKPLEKEASIARTVSSADRYSKSYTNSDDSQGSYTTRTPKSTSKSKTKSVSKTTRVRSGGCTQF